MSSHFGYRPYLVFLGGYLVAACSTAPPGPRDLEVIVSVMDESGAPAAGVSATVSYILDGQTVDTIGVLTDAGGQARDVWPGDGSTPDSVAVAVSSVLECARYQGGGRMAVPVLPSSETLTFAFAVVRAPAAEVEEGTSCAVSRADFGYYWLYLHVDSVIDQGPIERIYGIWQMPYATTRIDDRGAFLGTLALGDLVLDLDGVPNYQCSPIQFRLVARGVTDGVIGPATFESSGPCLAVTDTLRLVQTSVPWFP